MRDETCDTPSVLVDRELSTGQHLSTGEMLIGLRAELVQRRVTETPIVERLDVEQHVRLRLVAGVVHTVASLEWTQWKRAEGYRRIADATRQWGSARAGVLCPQTN